MKIGENSYYNKTSMLLEKNGYSITIGDNVAIGHWCYISTKMHCTDNHLNRFMGDIVIEDNVWIGNNVVIYPGVTIGKGCVIGNATTITRSVAAGKLVRNYKQITDVKR